MQNVKISFEIPENMLIALNESTEELTNQVRLSVALHFFKSHKLSLGKAAELAGIEKYEFREELFKNNIPIINYAPDELKRELEMLRK